jgi:hypothetical protein
MAVNINITVVWYVTRCNLVGKYHFWNESCASIFRIEEQDILSKRWYLCTRLHCVKSQKAAFLHRISITKTTAIQEIAVNSWEHISVLCGQKWRVSEC